MESETWSLRASSRKNQGPGSGKGEKLGVHVFLRCMHVHIQCVPSLCAQGCCMRAQECEKTGATGAWGRDRVMIGEGCFSLSMNE